ncbi:MAG: N-acetylmuramoyl-L-alanine amidase [Sphingomicrobium sp.]
MKRGFIIAISVGAILLAGMSALLMLRSRHVVSSDDALLGEARSGGVTVALAEPVQNVAITGTAAPGRPIVLIDPGHGGRDPGASGVSATTVEKDLTLALARELRDRLAKGGRVRVAMTRDGDDTLTLEQRADIARRIGATLFVSIHMDSAPNPAARGATVYSLSDVASDAEAARFASAENSAGGQLSSDRDASVRSLLADLALREQMTDSAALASRLVESGRNSVLLRPEPHKFAAFHVIRRSQVPGVLFEAGYLSNTDDEAMLLRPEGRKAIVAALANALEAQASILRAR